MIQLARSNGPRPYWHVDLKWISGILLLFALGAALLFFNLSKLTERDKAITLSATIVASLFSKDGLDDAKGLDEFRQKAIDTEGDVITPIPQFPKLTISKEQALTLGPRDLRIAIFSQLTKPIYDSGLKGAAAIISDKPEDQEAFAKQGALLGVFTKTTHDAMQRVFSITASIAVVLMAALIFFSSGWGRLVSPGLILLLVSPLGTFLALMVLHPPRDGDSPFTSLPANVAQDVGNSLSSSYVTAALIGIALLLSALIGKITQTILKKRSQNKSKLAKPKK